MSVGVYHYLALSAVLFSLGALGVLLRRNILIIFMSIELMLNAVNLSFIAFARLHGNTDGHLFSLFVIAVAAAEAAVGLAIVVLLFRQRQTVDVSKFNLIHG